MNEETYDADIAGGKEYESTLSTQINLTEKLSALERKRSKLDTALERAKTEKEYNNILARTMSNMEQQLALQRKINANESIERDRYIFEEGTKNVGEGQKVSDIAKVDRVTGAVSIDQEKYDVLGDTGQAAVDAYIEKIQELVARSNEGEDFQ